MSYSIMMEKINYHIQGIYDLRTFTFLKSSGIRSFGFDFNPRSLNFVQEYVFLDIFYKSIDSNDVIYLKFVTNVDILIPKLIDDMKKIRSDLSNIYFVFDEFIESETKIENYNYILNYHHAILKSHINHEFCRGIVIDFTIFDEVLSNGKLSNFCTNLINRFPKILQKDFITQLNLEWGDNLFSSLFDFVEINTIQLNLNKEVEICYRNIDLKKFESEFKIKQKYINY